MPVTLMAVVLGLLGLTWSRASLSHGRSAATTLQAAAAATAQAKSFTVLLQGVEVTYQAPDRVQQVEHGQGLAASVSGRGTSASTSGPFAETITKVFIGHRYYEADTPAGQIPVFSVSARCAGEQNIAESVLGILRALATSGDTQASGDRFAFHVPKGVAGALPLSGTATVRSGFVDGLSLSPAAHSPPAMIIGSINGAPPVTAPQSSGSSNVSCGP